MTQELNWCILAMEVNMPKTNDDNMVVLAIRVTKKMKEDLKENAKSRGLRVTDVVRYWIATGLYGPIVIHPNKQEIEHAQRLIDQIDPVALETWRLSIAERLTSYGGASVEENVERAVKQNSIDTDARW